MHERKRMLAPATLPAYHLMPPSLDILPPWVGLRYGLSVLLHGETEAGHKGHAENHVTQAG